ncbi:MAG: CDP-glycerol glycerophosphotransferase family protein [Coriobacteriales bacterium]|nr:CDP-glycerol glycerophosphotransferase family protein [Coriobacteriales bacterium]
MPQLPHFGKRELFPAAYAADPPDAQDLERLVDAERMRAVQAGCDFVFSVIVPVYNTQAYLEECIQSVLRQSVGFGDIQLILVDDGSDDDSVAICERYARQFPRNVVFCAQEHAGVSAARNRGLAEARGLWVNFLDSDDLWSEGAFACVLAFHATHPQVRVVTLRHWFFGARNEPHALGYKYKQDRVIDLAQDPGYPQLSFSNAFVESPLLASVRFNEELEVSEDFALINEVLMDVGCYGVCAKEAYLYRKRAAVDSAIDLCAQTPSYYDQTPRLCYAWLFQKSIERFGEVIPYIQHCIMYDLQWRLRRPVSTTIGAEQVARYRALLEELLSHIGDEVILAQRNMTFEQRLYAFALKYGVPSCALASQAVWREEQLVWSGPAGDVVLGTRDELEPTLTIDFLERRGDEVQIEGRCELLGFDARPSLRIEFSRGDGFAEVAYLKRADRRETVAFAEDAYAKLGFCVSLPWDGAERATIAARVWLGDACLDASFGFGNFVGLEASLAHTYWQHDGALFTMAGPSTLVVEPARGDVATMRLEAKLRAELVRSAPSGALLAACRTLGVAARGRRQRERKRIWLVCDRPTKAGDNGEALFAYLREHPVSGVEPIFLLSKDSPDWDRLSRLGHVRDFSNLLTLTLFFRANLVVSSSADAWALNPFGRKGRYLKDLYGFKFAFLQHGVTKDDQTAWLNRYNKNLSLFVASAQREYESLLEGAYGYGPDVVKLTGFPRHDSLLQAAHDARPQRVVYVMPTWRSNLSVGHIDPRTGMRPANPRFEASAFFAFYNALLGDARLNEALAARDYTLRLVMHPALEAEVDKFVPGPRTQVLARCDYRAAFLEGSLFVTDYSSVTFDVALLKKPIVYAQFDQDTFFEGHSYARGYFSYEQDGFGPVCTTLDETVDAMVAALDDNGVMPEQYQRRMDAFFGEQPVCRCAEVVSALQALEEEGTHE